MCRITGIEDILPTIEGGKPSFPGTLAPRAALRPLPDRGRSLCYRRSFELAEAAGAQSIAFPAISTGAYGFPKERAAVIAVREMTAREDRFERIIACCFSEADATFYRRLLPAAHLGPRPDRDDHQGS